MDNRESKAAAMRQTWLGDAAGEAVAWDELKQCVRDRWLAALDAAQPEVLPPLSDEIIERMAEATRLAYGRGGKWRDAIRAALAAVGPQYCPADVAFNSRVPELEKELAEARAELAAAEIELADKSFYVREFAAVSAERDGLKKRNEIQAEQLIRIDSEISPLMSEVAELKAELAAMKAQPGCELDVTAEEAWQLYKTGHKGCITAMQPVLDLYRSRIRPAAPFGSWHFENGKIVPNGMPQAPRTYTDADVKKLAEVLRAAYMKECHIEPNPNCPPNRGYVAEARAALDWIGATVGENVQLRTREVGDEVGNLLQEIADLNNRIADMELAYKTLLESHEILADSPSEAELRAELARVKAESLRVVYLPDDYEFMPDYYMTPDGIGWNSSDRHGDCCVETPEGYRRFDECRKIKLEHWEDEG